MGYSGIIFKTYTGGVVNIPEFTEDKTKETDWHCYPNPVKDILNIVPIAIGIADFRFMIFKYSSLLLSKIRLIRFVR